MRKILKIFFVLIIILTCITIIYSGKEMKTKEYNTIAFLGDSITEFGWTKDHGYIRKFDSMLKEKGKNITIIPAGIGGNSTYEMLNRIDNDVLSKNPDVVFVMGGINDIVKFIGTFDDYKLNMDMIINKIREAKAEPIVMNITIVTEDVNSDANLQIDQYNEFLKELCAKKNVQMIDLNTELKNELKKHENENDIVTYDGIHLNELGDTILANKIMNDFMLTHKL